MTTAYLLLDGWAGRRRIPVEVLSETPARYRVRLEQAALVGRRHCEAGAVVLAPKHAVEFDKETTPMDPTKVSPADILDYIYNHPTEFSFLGFDGSEWELGIGMWPDDDLPFACYAVIRASQGTKYAGQAHFGERSLGSETVDEALATLMKELEAYVESKR